MKKILVIDDERELLEEILDILSFEGYNVLGAESGEEGVQLAQQHLPDLILCDIMMPGLDGYGVLMALQNDSATRLIPFIFLTAKAGKQHQRYGMELGADDYLTKPFTHDELLAAVKTRLAKNEVAMAAYENRLDDLRYALSHTLSHELRTPLVGILGNSELMVMDAENMEADQIQRLAWGVLRSGKRLHRLVENYLLYTQIEHLKIDPRKIIWMHDARTDNPVELIHNAVSQIAAERGRAADLIWKGSREVAVHIREENLRKIAEELVDNAFKFSQPGTKVAISVFANGDKLVLTVVDHGRGMTAEQLKQIGAYVQFDRQKYEQQGSGLGLAIAKSIVELHEGKLNIESVYERGTKVWVELPLA